MSEHVICKFYRFMLFVRIIHAKESINGSIIFIYGNSIHLTFNISYTFLVKLVFCIIMVFEYGF